MGHHRGRRLRRLLEPVGIAFAMYSRLPVPQLDWTGQNMRYALCWFPLIGVVEGGLLLLWSWLAVELRLSPALFGAVAALLPLALTGGIHLDGFCDTVDALSSHQPAERKLEILKDPHVGAFAVMGCSGYLLLLFALWCEWYRLAAGHPSFFRLAGVVACCGTLCRCESGFSVVSLRCAKSTGLAAAFSGAAQRRRVRAVTVTQGLLTAGLMALCHWSGALPVLVSLGMLALYRRVAYREFGGITGDLAGWFLQCSQLLMLAAAVAALLWAERMGWR